MRHLRTATAASALLLALGLAACGGDDKDAAASTTAAAEQTTTTTEPTAHDTTTTTTTGDDSGSGSDETTTTVDTTVDDAWRANAVEFRDDVDSRHDFDCPAGGTEGLNVWGNGPFTDDSSVCTAAVFAGAITYDDGGTVTIVMTGPQDSFDPDEANGVTTQEYGEWPGSFDIVPEG